MNLVYGRVICVIYVCALICGKCYAQYEVPEPRVEAFNPRGFRISIPDAPGIQFFAVHINVNEPISPVGPGEYSGEISRAVNGRWTYENQNAQLQPGDVLNYWMFVQHDRLGYRRDEERFTITALTSRNSDFVDKPLIPTRPSPTPSGNCVPSITTINGGQSTCQGQLILDEQFNGAKIDETKWQQDCHIPSDAEDYEFVSYQARPENAFLSNGRLSMWPTILKNQELIQEGELNLTSICGCSSDNQHGTCYRRAMSYNVLQPVVSASIRSRLSFRYGRVEIRAKLPSGNWLYPVLNLESHRNEYGRGFKSGRMRIAFARGNKALTTMSGRDYGAKELSAGLILGQHQPPRNHSTKTKTGSSPWSDDFHTYELKWTQDNVQVSVDGSNYGTITPPSGGFQTLKNLRYLEYAKDWTGSAMSPFDKEMVLRIALACGGVTDFPDGTSSSSVIGPPRPKPWMNLDPKAILRFWQDTPVWESSWMPTGASLQVDYVKIWAI